MLVCCVLLCLTGCGSNKEAQRSVLRVGVVLYTQDDPFINALTDCLKEDLEDYETDSLKIIMTVRDGKNDQKLQDEVVEEILDAGCDILVVDLVDRTEPSNIIKMAKNENIPVIFFNREPVREDLMQWDKLYYVGGDARQSGTMQGEIAAQVIRTDHTVYRNADGKIQYVLLEGETGHQDAIIRTDSVVKTLQEQGITLEKLSYQFANWNRGQAENKMTQLIHHYGDEIELVLSNNDEMALGAVNAYNNLDESTKAILKAAYSAKNNSEESPNIVETITNISKQFVNNNNNSTLIIVLVSIGAIVIVAGAVIVLLKRKKHIA